MKRSGPPKRRGPMKRSAALQNRGSTAKPKPRPVRPVAIDFSAATKQRRAAMRSHRCWARLPGCAGEIEEYHHRQLRSQGGDGRPSNCLPCCSSCHREIHSRPRFAQRHGLIVKSNRDPESIEAFGGCSFTCITDHVGQ